MNNVVALNSVYEAWAVTQEDRSGNSTPDPFLGGVPNNDFVLCRDSNDKPTAIYGQNKWDLNPYALGRTIRVFNFASILRATNTDAEILIKEAKWVIFCLMYHVNGGRAGRLSVSSLANYYDLITKAVRFCYEQRMSPLVGESSLESMLSNRAYLAGFINTAPSSRAITYYLPSLLNHLNGMGEEVLGYRVTDPKTMAINNPDGTSQTPVIPLRIYMLYLQHFSDTLDRLEPCKDWLPALLSEFRDPNFGRTKDKQRTGKRGFHRPEIRDAVAAVDHGVFTAELSASNLRSFSKSLKTIQFFLKQIIHFYSGMRDYEVMRLKHNCITTEAITQATISPDGKTLDPGRTCAIVSTTTKFKGYRHECSWIATSEVVRAIRIAQAINQGLAGARSIDVNSLPLFANTSFITGRGNPENPPDLDSRSTDGLIPKFEIGEADITEMKEANSLRDILDEAEFAVGQPWPLASHQYRRSLSFYATNSGFVSLPTLKKQFKHVSREMAKYYTNGNENLKTIFGYFDEVTGELKLPASHIANEMQLATPASAANQLLSDIMSDDEPLFGATGSRLEAQKRKYESGEITIYEIREDTEKQVRIGSIAYRETLLGGCTKVGECDAYMLADYTECLSCPKSIIKPSMLDAELEIAETEVAGYEKTSAEYQQVKRDIDLIKRFKTDKTQRQETNNGGTR